MKKSLIALLLVVALVVTVSVFAVSAEDTNPFEGQTGTVKAYCQACGKEVDWTPLVSNASNFINNTHTYLTANTYKNSGTTMKEAGQICVNLNGFKLYRTTTTSGLVDIQHADAVFSVFDTSVNGTGSYELPDARAGAVVTMSAGTFNLYGGKLCRPAAAAATTNGACAYLTGGTFNMYGGELYGWGLYQGGVVYMGGTAKFNMDDGYIHGKCSSNGGAVRVAGSAVFTMNGGTITGECVAGNGGSIYMDGGDFILDGGTITDGKAPDRNGGNVYVNSANSEFKMISGTVTKGTALRVAGTSNGNAGNIYVNVGTFTMEGGTISGGLDTAQSAHCGNLFLAASAVGNIKGGTITGGRTANYGGNIYSNGAKLTIDADEGKTVKITNGVASAGGNIYIRNENGNATTITGPDVTISGGDDGTKIAASSATEQVGSQIMVYSNVDTKPSVLNIKDVTIDSSEVHTTELALFKNAQLNVFGEKTIDTVYIVNADSCKVTVQEGYTGSLFVRWREATCTNNVVNGGTLDASLTAVAAYANSGVVKGVDGSRSAKTAGWDGTNFVIATYGGFKADAEGNVTETPLVEMPSEAGEYDFIRPYFETPITLKADTTLDVNNNTLTVDTNGFKLSLIETRSVDFSDKKAANSDDDMIGYVVVDDPANLMPTTKENAYGNQYITLPFGQGYTARRVSVDIDSVSIKPKNVDLYYTTNMDTSLLASQYAVSYGVVLSLVDMPGADFVSDDINGDGKKDNLYTEIDFNLPADERVHVEGANSALLEGILTKDAETNQTYGEQPIYANAYICFNINNKDVYVMADKTYELSLKEILMELDKTNAATSEVAVNMYKNWQNPMAAWANDLPNMAAAAAEQA